MDWKFIYVFIFLFIYIVFISNVRVAVVVVFALYRGGLMVSAPDSGSRGPGSSHGRVIVVRSWESASLHPGV